MNRNIVKRSHLFVSLLTFFVTFIFSYSIGELFYNSVDGTDFLRYLRVCSFKPLGVWESLTKIFKSLLELITATSDNAENSEVTYF